MKKKDLAMLKKELPKCPVILGREKYFNSSVLIPLVLINEEYHFLFQKRSANIRQKGEICFPGGMIDPELDTDRHGLSYRKTAIRETIEELGIEKSKIKIEGRLGTIVAPMGAAVEAFIGILNIENLSELNIQVKEVENIFTIPVSFFTAENLEEYRVRIEIQPEFTDENGKEVVLLPVKDLDIPESYEKPWGGRLYRIFAYRTEKGTIWGITAELIYEVAKILNSI